MATKDPNTQSVGQSTTLTELPTLKASASRLKLPLNHAFQYWADPTRLSMRAGVATYSPVKIEVIPGVQNVPGDGDPATMESYQKRKLDRVAVPLDFEVVAWGKKRRGYLVRLNVGQDARGKELFHYHDAWTKYDFIGGRPIRSFDADGWADFERRCTKLLGDKPHPVLVDAERSRLKGAAAQHRRIAHQSPGAAHHAEQIEAKYTPEGAAA